MKKPFLSACAATALIAMPSVAFAATIVEFETGVDEDGGADGIDDNFTLDGGSALVAEEDDLPGTWVDNSASSSDWIIPNPLRQPPGSYDFEIVLSLAEIAKVTGLNLTFWADNSLRNVFVNGVDIFSGPGGNFTGSTTLNTIIDGPVTDTVSITFRVRNADNGRNNPTGFRVEGALLTSAVPEPATWLMMILGLGLIGGAMRRRPKQTVSVSYA